MQVDVCQSFGGNGELIISPIQVVLLLGKHRGLYVFIRHGGNFGCVCIDVAFLSLSLIVVNRSFFLTIFAPEKLF